MTVGTTWLVVGADLHVDGTTVTVVLHSGGRPVVLPSGDRPRTRDSDLVKATIPMPAGEAPRVGQVVSLRVELEEVS